MGTTYLSPNTLPITQSVFIATPAYEATKPGYSFSLALTTAELTRHNIPFELGVMEGNCHVDDGRNALVARFLKSNCTDLLFIDSDLRWSPENTMKILAWDEDLVAGAYPMKCNPTKYPVGRIFQAHDNGLVEVSYAPTGFMRIRRNVFDKLLPKQSRHGQKNPIAVFFERRFNNKTRDGGDVTFCRKWIAEGGKVMVDSNLHFEHIGENRWSGTFKRYLNDPENAQHHVDEISDPNAVKGDPPAEMFVSDNSGSDIQAVLQRIVAGDESSLAFSTFADVWGNKPWAATYDFLQTMWKMVDHLPDGSKVLECGTGASTLLLAAAAERKNLELICLEEFPEWAEHTNSMLQSCDLDARIICAPMKNGWYNCREQLTDFTADLIVIDGPKRREGVSRLYPLDKSLSIVGGNCVVIVDDCKDLEAGGSFINAGSPVRPFCVGRLGEGAEILRMAADGSS